MLRTALEHKLRLLRILILFAVCVGVAIISVDGITSDQRTLLQILHWANLAVVLASLCIFLLDKGETPLDSISTYDFQMYDIAGLSDKAQLEIYLPSQACNWESDPILNAAGELMEQMGYELEPETQEASAENRTW